MTSSTALWRPSLRGCVGLASSAGDRVAAYLPNIPEAVIALLATASIGAIWSSCSPDFGERSVVDRFRQIEPTVLITVDGYRYGGRDFDRGAVSEEIRRNLPGLKATIVVENLGGRPLLEGAIRWEDLLGEDEPLVFEPVPFGHPLWVLYSSGTTGLPKAVVQSHGGILLEHLKTLTFHFDLSEDDRFFWFSTTGWMMWNVLVGGLLIGATCVLYDGSPGYPDIGRALAVGAGHRHYLLWRKRPLHFSMHEGRRGAGTRLRSGCVARHRLDGVAPAAGVLWLGV